MEDNSLQGNLAAIPFAQLLFRIWQKEQTGALRIQKENFEKRLSFDKGNITLERSTFPEQEFIKTLLEKEILSTPELERSQQYAGSQGLSLTRAMIELGIFSPLPLWELMTSFWKADLFPLFDWSEAEYVFASSQSPQEGQVFATILTLDLILQGIRRMRNHDLIQAFLPPEGESLQMLVSDLLNLVTLEPHEAYLLKAMSAGARLQDLYGWSELGKRESQKVIFALCSLGIIGAAPPTNQAKTSPEPSPLDVDKMISAFNDKCSYIYKYISKEIGPVALNVLEKSLDEIRPRLGNLFQAFKLRADGRIDIKQTAKMSLNLHPEENRKIFIRGLNEILAAEVLAVKRTLGNAHESMLVKNLEKIGESS